MRIYHEIGWHKRIYQIILSLVLAFPVYADIVTDGTVGQAQNLTGPNFTIPESLGSRAGANLFHSFQRFNVFQGESATFTGSDSTANVISRVTGGQASTINGLLRSTVGQADFYFINPAGVMFGANAQIDVPGSFNVSTADELRFPNGEVFSATDPVASTLSIDQPKSFGFLGDQTAKINVVGSTLELNPGETLSLSAGELVIAVSSLSSEAGEIQLVSVGDIATKVNIDSAISEPAQGDLNINVSLINVDGNGAGRINIRGGQSEINFSSISANNTGPLDASSTQGVDIKTSSLKVATSFITTNTTGQNAADLSVTVANQLSIVSGGGILSSTNAEGNAGEVTVTAGQMQIDGKGLVTGIFSPAFSESTGNAGKVNVEVTDLLSIMNAGGITSNTFAEGNAGEVTVKADQLMIDGHGQRNFTGISSDARANFSGNVNSRGNGGKVNVEVTDLLSIVNAGGITSNTFAEGNAGEVTVKADRLMINGHGQGIFTGISSNVDVISSGNVNSRGNAGKVNVEVTDLLSIVNAGAISSKTFAEGSAGEVIVGSGNIFIDRQGSQFLTGISSRAGVNSSGQAGTVTLDTKNLFVANGAKISIESFPTVDTTALVNIKPSQININAENITLTNASITTESSGNVPAGSIILNVADTLSLDPSTISTAANNANGGAITIRAKTIDVQDSQITTSVSGQGNGGDIDLVSNALVLDTGFIQANTNGINATGGDIRINTNALVASNNILLTGGNTPLSFQPGLNVIQAAAPDGVSGNINITSPQLDISGDLIDLDSELPDVDDLAQNPCASVGGRESTLVNLGRGGMPESPQQAGSIAITRERLQYLLPLADNETVPLPGTSNQQPGRQFSKATFESKKEAAWIDPNCS